MYHTQVRSLQPKATYHVLLLQLHSKYCCRFCSALCISPSQVCLLTLQWPFLGSLTCHFTSPHHKACLGGSRLLLLSFLCPHSLLCSQNSQTGVMQWGIEGTAPPVDDSSKREFTSLSIYAHQRSYLFTLVPTPLYLLMALHAQHAPYQNQTKSHDDYQIIHYFTHVDVP